MLSDADEPRYPRSKVSMGMLFHMEQLILYRTAFEMGSVFLMIVLQN